VWDPGRHVVMFPCCGMAKSFLPYQVDQHLLLPPDMRQWLPEEHLALFVLDVVLNLDLSAIYKAYDEKDDRGRAAYDPKMMVALLVYAYCVGKPSSRRIEKATYEDVGFRVLSGDAHPDHASIAEFRKRHLRALSGLFVQVLRLCQKAGLVKLGHVALDGTKIQANASKHKAMSYGRMRETERKLEEEVAKLMAEAERVDAEEDARYGRGKRGDELPAELARRESRLKKIREAKAELEAEAKAEAEERAKEARQRLVERARKEEETGKKIGGRPPQVPVPEEAKPKDKAQRNFTDPDSRIMMDGATKAFVQGYNAQIAVDSQAQIIVACAVTQAANDQRQLVPMGERIQTNVGTLPENLSADAGYFSAEAVTSPVLTGVNLLVPPDRKKQSDPSRDDIGECSEASSSPSEAEKMRQKLRTEAGHDLYRMRKAIVEPVFGQTKEARGFRRFLLRGVENVGCEFDLISLTHNLLKLFRASACVQPA